MPSARNRSSVASMYATKRKTGIRRDPVAPGVKAGAGLKKPIARTAASGRNKAYGAAGSMR
jgi:hypothetical protein